jgi:hypothetical protein
MAENEPVGGLTQVRQSIEGLARDFPEQYRQAQENIQQNLEQGRAANSALMQFLQSQRGTGPSPMLQLASGLLRPTRAGGFGESLAAGAEGYAGALQQQRQSELDRAMRIQQLQQATANLNMQATQQRMALTGQALQFPTQLSAAQGALADYDLLQGGQGQQGVPQTRTQLAVPGAAQGPMPSASPVGPQPQVTATPLPPPGMPEDSPAVAAARGQAPGAPPPPAPMPAAPMPAAAAPAPAGAPAPAAAQSSDPLVAGAQRLLADAAANPSRYAGPQGRQLVERARTIMRESPEARAEVKRAEEQAQEDVRQQNAAAAANRRFGEESATQQARSFAELAGIGAEARQLRDRLQMFDQVSADLRSGIPGFVDQQLARAGFGERASYIETATALLKQLIPAQRQGMPGAVSNFDAENFEKSLPRLIGTPDGRAMISNTLKSVAEYNIARSQIASDAVNRRIAPDVADERINALPSPFARFNQMERERLEANQRRRANVTRNEDGSFNWSPGAP